MISHTEPRKKKTRLCALCQQRPPVCRINPVKSPLSRTAVKGKRVHLKNHDLCRQCWTRLTQRTRVVAPRKEKR